MWNLCLVSVASQVYHTWSQCLSPEHSASNDIRAHASVLFQSSQALVHYEGMISVLDDKAQIAQEERHELDDDYLYVTSALPSNGTLKTHNETSKTERSVDLPKENNKKHGEGALDMHRQHKKRHKRHRVHKAFVHGDREGVDRRPSHHNDHHHVSAPHTIATVIALMLMGMMAMSVSVFYLVNYPDEDIQQVTWTILSSTISLFCAVLIFSALKCIIELLLGERVGLHSHRLKPDGTLVVSSFVHFIMTFILTQVLVVVHREQKFSLQAWAQIGGHITAFAAIDAFGNLMHYSFSSTWLKGLLLLVLALFVMWGLSTFARCMRVWLEPKSKEKQIFFHEECDDAGCDSMSLAMGFLISLLVRQTTTGHLPPIHGSPRDKMWTEILQLFSWATAFILALVILTYLAHDVLKESSANRASYWARLGQSTLSMSAGWCLLSWGQWFFWSSIGERMGEADKMEARMLMAIAFSVLVFAFIFIFDFIADRIDFQSGVRALISTMALLLGLAWEAVFTLAIESICENYIKHPAQYIYCELGLTFGLCSVVLPAWVMYVIPQAEEGKYLVEEQM